MDVCVCVGKRVCVFVSVSVCACVQHVLKFRFVLDGGLCGRCCIWRSLRVRAVMCVLL